MSSSRSASRLPGNVPTVIATPVSPRLRRSPVPKPEPRAASRVARWDDDRPPATQGTLALALGNTFDPRFEDPRENSTAARAPRTNGAAVGLLPEPYAWGRTFIQAAMEVAAGLRSAGQLVRWTTPEVHLMLVRRGALTLHARRSGAVIGTKPRLRALLLCSPRPGVCEFSAVIGERDRVRAVAFRMEGLHGRWRVTEMEIG